MKHVRHIVILYLVIATLIAIAIYTNYQRRNSEVVIVETPEIQGVLLDTIPEEKVLDSIFIYELRDTIVKYSNPVDTVYIAKFIQMNEREKEVEYAEAIKYRTYENIINNDTLSLKYVANTQGKLLDIQFDYKIKPQVFSVPVVSKNQGNVYGGFGMRSTTNLENLTPTLSLGYRNSHNHITTVSYGNDFNNNKSISVSYMFPLFNTK